jgi:hypothetical protein
MSRDDYNCPTMKIKGEERTCLIRLMNYLILPVNVKIELVNREFYLVVCAMGETLIKLFSLK